MTHQRVFPDPVPRGTTYKEVSNRSGVGTGLHSGPITIPGDSVTHESNPFAAHRVSIHKVVHAVHWKGDELDDEPNTSPEKAILQILDYFLRHPEAVDSADGIAHWRLLGEGSQLSLTETEVGLSWLVSRGYLREVAVPGSRHVYALDAEMQDKAAQFLKEARRRPQQS